jgi:guanylate kinase
MKLEEGILERLNKVEEDIMEIKNVVYGKNYKDKDDGWTYNQGNDEAALLHNLEHPEYETIGKIYYIQSYMNTGSKYSGDEYTIQYHVPYRVIGINHEGTNNTVDLMSCVAVNYILWNDFHNDWTCGKYSTSGLYNWIGSKCQNGYSHNIRTKMCNMTERWREATGNNTGTLQTRSTKVKLLNPVELFGSFSALYDGAMGTVSDFIQYDYGSHYSGIFSNSISPDTFRAIYHDTAMSDACIVWTNSWYGFSSSSNNGYCFHVYPGGLCNNSFVCASFGVAPVIRLSAGSSDWQYDEGNDEVALLHNLEHPEREQLNKIYYIQSYMNDGNKHKEGTPTIQQNVPYKVIGINHEGTSNTVDLQAMVAVNYINWHTRANHWSYGKYSTSKLYDWLPNTCANGFSDSIQAKMVNMTERWREATGNDTGILQTRSTKVKLLNPVELFGSSAATYNPYWELGNQSDHRTKFLSDNYGTQYPIYSNSIYSSMSRVLYHDKAMTDRCWYFTNSWLAYSSFGGGTKCFYVNTDGSCSSTNVNYYYGGVAPVIRLSAGNSDWQYDDGNDEKALLNNIKHPEHEQLGKIYYIQSYMNAGTIYTPSDPIIQQNIPYKVIGINHDGTNNTVDLMSCVAVNYIKWHSRISHWSYGKYSISKLYDWLPTCANGYSDNIQAKMCNMTERWREASGNTTGTLQTRSTKCKILNPVELFGSSAATYDPCWEYGNISDHKDKFLSDNYGTQYPIWKNSKYSSANRVLYHDKAMTDRCWYFTNSWLAFSSSSGGGAKCFYVTADGSCRGTDVNYYYGGIAPVIRLSDAKQENIEDVDSEEDNIDTKINFICSYTTRPKREGEVDGKEHIFIDNDEADKLLKESNILAYTEINGCRYFTLADQLKDYNGYIVDPDGIKELISSNKKYNLGINIAIIYIYASKDTRKHRYLSRVIDSKYDISYMNHLDADLMSSIEDTLNEFYSRDNSETEQFDAMERAILHGSYSADEIDNIFGEESPYVLSNNPLPTIFIMNDDNLVNGIVTYSTSVPSFLKKFIQIQRRNDPNTLFCVVGRTASGKDTFSRMLSK